MAVFTKEDGNPIILVSNQFLKNYNIFIQGIASCKKQSFHGAFTSPARAHKLTLDLGRAQETSGWAWISGLTPNIPGL